LLKNKGKLQPKVYNVPIEMDKEIASLWLRSQGMGIDELSDSQREYLNSWQ
jgi:adenosylhomocysteinase